MDHPVTVETSDKRPRFIGVVIVIITFGIFGLWSLVAPLQSAALAPGKVMVKGSRKNIEHLEGGIVAELPVRDGDHVAAGDLLVLLDDTQPRAQLEMAMGQYYAVKARESRLQAERDGVDVVNYPSGIFDGQDPRAADAVQSQNQVFVASRNARLGEMSVLRQRVSSLGEQIKGTGMLKKG